MRSLWPVLAIASLAVATTNDTIHNSFAEHNNDNYGTTSIAGHSSKHEAESTSSWGGGGGYGESTCTKETVTSKFTETCTVTSTSVSVSTCYETITITPVRYPSNRDAGFEEFVQQIPGARTPEHDYGTLTRAFGFVKILRLFPKETPTSSIRYAN
jgi:hypothetical protein